MTATLDPKLFLPDPEPRDARYTIISVDDHVVEPLHLFERYLPPGMRERGPQIVEAPNGAQIWEFEGTSYLQLGMNAVAGRRPETVHMEPFRYDQMRPGCYDVDARIADMDAAGIWAMVNFPSQITGFCGRVFADANDVEVGKACVRAWNDWIFEEWYSPNPDRIVPLRHHVPLGSGGGGGGDRAQRGKGFRVRHAARTPACDRPSVAVGPGPLGADHPRLRRDRHRHLAPCRAARVCIPFRRAAPSCRSPPRCSANSLSAPAPSGSGPATPRTIPT